MVIPIRISEKEEADYLTRSAPVAIGSEKVGIDFSVGTRTDLFLYYLSVDDINHFQRNGSWEQKYYCTKSSLAGESDTVPGLLGTFRRDHSYVVGAKLAYGRPLPIKCKAERNKSFYQANFALEELLGGSVAFPAEANCLIRALESNGRQSSPSQTKREAQQSLALLVFAILFLLLASIVPYGRRLVFS
jgi:hypothetical protein